MNIIVIYLAIANLSLPNIIQHKYLSNDNLKEYTINGKCVVNNIENGSDTDQQELRIDDGKKNYYMTLPSKIPVSSGVYHQVTKLIFTIKKLFKTNLITIIILVKILKVTL